MWGVECVYSAMKIHMKGNVNVNNKLIKSSYKDATGSIAFNMTNDYMFRAILQKNKNVLKGIICAVLHLNPDEVQSAHITNPIELGNDMDDKTFVLDINVLLNDDALINLEMQVVNEHNWQDRSLSYLCRSYDQLYQGQAYSQAKPAIHIGFLNFKPFPDSSEFFSTYKLMNEKTGRIYSDKFLLYVIDLTQRELSLDEDKEFQIDTWAQFFTASSWEEVIMIAEKNPYIEEAAQALYEANADEMIEWKCRARRDYYKQKNTTEKMLRELKEEIGEKENALSKIESELQSKESQLQSKEIEIELLREKIKELEARVQSQ